MRRLAIIGISGAGKTHLARVMQARTHLPLHHMDSLLWRDAWESVPEAEYVFAHRTLISGERWIIEGFIDSVLAERAQRADQIVYLDFPGTRCAWRVFGRWLRHRRIARAELPPRAIETLSLRFLWLVLRRGERPAIEACLRSADPAKVVRLKSERQLQRFVRGLTS